MYISFTFIAYMAATFIALLGIGIAILLFLRKDAVSSELYKGVIGFAVIVFLYSILYFYFYFSDMFLEDYSIGTVLRVIDYALYGSILFMWIVVIGRLFESDGFPSGSVCRWGCFIGTVRILAGIVASVFFMDEYYCFINHQHGKIFSIIEMLLVFITIIVILGYSIEYMRKALGRRHKVYVGFVSVIIVLWDVQQVFIERGLYLGRFVSAWVSGIPDSAALALFLMGLATFIFIFREDFSPLFYAKETREGTEYSMTDIAAQQHNLTEREAEVMKLMFEGYNNPEIAEKLYISRNTVKHHVRSIYEKMGISSRVELVHLIKTRPEK